MTEFDMFCMWLGRLVLGGSALLVSLSLVALLVFKLIERVFGKDRMDRSIALSQDLLSVLHWHQKHIEDTTPAKKEGKPL